MLITRWVGLLFGVFVLVFSGCGGGDAPDSTANTAPIASAGTDRSVSIGSEVSLIGNSSSDVDGDLLTYAWSITDQPAGSSALVANPTGSLASLAPDVDGTYTIQLIVNDGVTDSEFDTMVVSAFIPTSPIPDTGQTEDYTAIFGEDSDYIINPPSYTDNEDGTVTDNVTDLMWQQQDDDIRRTWDDAGVYCDDLALASYADWRLPTKMELVSIFHFDNSPPDPLIDKVVFPGTNTAGYYWSSITAADNISAAWPMNYRNGFSNRYFKTSAMYTRCVRGQQISGPSLTDNGDSTVTDEATGLMWQQTEGGSMDFESALAYCESLPLGEYKDWRLPNYKELESLSDGTTYNPSLDTSYFPDTQEEELVYWTSTSYISDPLDPLFVQAHVGNFYVGVLSYFNKGSILSVRCVR